MKFKSLFKSYFWLLPISVLLLSSCSGKYESSVELKQISIEEFLSDKGQKSEVGKKKINVYLDDSPYLLIDNKPQEVLTTVDSVVYQTKNSILVSENLNPVRIALSGKGDYEFVRKIYFQNSEDPEIKKSKLVVYSSHPLIENDGIALGVLIIVLALIFWTSSKKTKFWNRFYTFLPALLLCYFVPAILNTAGIIDGDNSQLYFVSSRFLLPASLVLLCLSVDLKGIINLGPKALIMFGTATVGIIIGAPLALYLVSLIEPGVLGGEGPNALWRGLSTISGSWIGGGANQTAMKEISETQDVQFSLMILVDVFIANIWMAFLLFGAGKSDKLDKKLKADSSAITELKKNIENYQASIARNITFNDLIFMLAIAFGCTAVGHLIGDTVAPAIANWIDAILANDKDNWVKFISSFGKHFFWLILIATILGVGLSFTKARKLEGAGASKVGSIFLYILVASIGMHIDFEKVIMEWESIKYILAIGFIWMLIHIILLLTIAKLIKAPFFFVAVGSQANIGGAASAPIVASAFSPALAPVGVLLAVLGYAIGTVGAITCMELMHMIS